MRLSTPIALSALVLATTGSIAAPRGERAAPAARLEVVEAGGESALRYKGEMIGRPFGAELVDGLDVIGRHRVGGEDVYIVGGTRGDECPARYVAVTIRRSGAPIVSEPFGTCGVISASQSRDGLSVTMPRDDGTPITYAYAAGEMRPAVTLALVAQEAAAPQRCRLYGQVGTSPAEGTALIASFERDYPQALRRGGRVDRAGLSRDQLQEIVVGMACLATWPGADPLVPETARPLFRHRTYGPDAFAMLDAVARAPDTEEPLRAAVRAFSAKMYYQASLDRGLLG